MIYCLVSQLQWAKTKYWIIDKWMSKTCQDTTEHMCTQDWAAFYSSKRTAGHKNVHLAKHYIWQSNNPIDVRPLDICWYAICIMQHVHAWSYHITVSTVTQLINTEHWKLFNVLIECHNELLIVRVPHT